jgi:hypothetical protein
LPSMFNFLISNVNKAENSDLANDQSVNNSQSMNPELNKDEVSFD